MSALARPGVESRGTANRGPKVMITLAALITLAVPPIADLNATHLIGSAWSPHALYHGWVFLFVNVISGSAALYLVWGRHGARDNPFALRMAAFLPALCWGPQLLAVFMPGASSWPDGSPEPPPLPVAGNVVMSAVIVVLCGVAAWRPGRLSKPSTSQDG